MSHIQNKEIENFINFMIFKMEFLYKKKNLDSRTTIQRFSTIDFIENPLINHNICEVSHLPKGFLSIFTKRGRI